MQNDDYDNADGADEDGNAVAAAVAADDNYR